jgi:hypothetical protein
VLLTRFSLSHTQARCGPAAPTHASPHCQASPKRSSRARFLSTTGSWSEWGGDTRGGRRERTLGELGIDTNPGATITELILEDEKAEGTIHLAFGTNTGFGGDNQASVHIDGLVRDAYVELAPNRLTRTGAERFSPCGFGRHIPCMTLVYVAGLATPTIKVEVDAWASASDPLA